MLDKKQKLERELVLKFSDPDKESLKLNNKARRREEFFYIGFENDELKWANALTNTRFCVQILSYIALTGIASYIIAIPIALATSFVLPMLLSMTVIFLAGAAICVSFPVLLFSEHMYLREVKNARDTITEHGIVGKKDITGRGMDFNAEIGGTRLYGIKITQDELLGMRREKQAIYTDIKDIQAFIDNALMTIDIADTKAIVNIINGLKEKADRLLVDKNFLKFIINDENIVDILNIKALCEKAGLQEKTPGNLKRLLLDCKNQLRVSNKNKTLPILQTKNDAIKAINEFLAKHAERQNSPSFAGEARYAYFLSFRKAMNCLNNLRLDVFAYEAVLRDVEKAMSSDICDLFHFHNALKPLHDYNVALLDIKPLAKEAQKKVDKIGRCFIKEEDILHSLPDSVKESSVSDDDCQRLLDNIDNFMNQGFAEMLYKLQCANIAFVMQTVAEEEWMKQHTVVGVGLGRGEVINVCTRKAALSPVPETYVTDSNAKTTTNKDVGKEPSRLVV